MDEKPGEKALDQGAKQGKGVQPRQVSQERAGWIQDRFVSPNRSSLQKEKRKLNNDLMQYEANEKKHRRNYMLSVEKRH